MSPEDETEITARFSLALTGRFGPLKPAQAIARCMGYITELRMDHLAWAEIDRLFNAALTGLGGRRLSPGSVSRLYHVQARREHEPNSPAGTAAPNEAGFLQAPAAPSEDSPTQERGPALALPLARFESATPTDPAVHDEMALGQRQLRRIEVRRELRKRMDEA